MLIVALADWLHRERADVITSGRESITRGYLIRLVVLPTLGQAI
jgi:hypothetical protein